MGYMTRWGGLFAQLPQHRGNVYFVAPGSTYVIEGRTYSSSDTNDGLSPERALATVTQAITNTTAGNGDVVVLLPGAHTVTGALALSKSDVHLWGIPGNYVFPLATLTQATASTAVATVSAADVEIANIRVIPLTASPGITFTAAANRLYIHDCAFDMTATANTSMFGIGHAGTSYTVNPANVWICHNYFEITGAQGPAIQLGDCSDFIVERNTFAVKGGTLANLTLQGGVLGWGIYRDNDVMSLKNATITKGITGTDITSTKSVGILRNYFGGTITTPIDDWGSTDAMIAENYVLQGGAASGGALWSSIT